MHTGRPSDVRQLNSGGHSTVAAATAQLASLHRDDTTSSGFVPSYTNTTRSYCHWKSWPSKTLLHKFLITPKATFWYRIPFNVSSTMQQPSTDSCNEPTAIDTLWVEGRMDECSNLAVFSFTQWTSRVHESTQLLSLHKNVHNCETQTLWGLLNRTQSRSSAKPMFCSVLPSPDFYTSSHDDQLSGTCSM